MLVLLLRKRKKRLLEPARTEGAGSRRGFAEQIEFGSEIRSILNGSSPGCWAMCRCSTAERGETFQVLHPGVLWRTFLCRHPNVLPESSSRVRKNYSSPEQNMGG